MDDWPDLAQLSGDEQRLADEPTATKMAGPHLDSYQCLSVAADVSFASF